MASGMLCPNLAMRGRASAQQAQHVPCGTSAAKRYVRLSRVPAVRRLSRWPQVLQRSGESGKTLLGAASNGVAALGNGHPGYVTGVDLAKLEEAARLADSSAGVTQPHPNAAVILVSADGRQVGRAFLRAQGTISPEVQAVLQAGEAARGATAYLNLESGDCHGDFAAVEALVQGGVSRVVLGLRHPLAHLRGAAVQQLLAAGIRVDVLGEAPYLEEEELAAATAFEACLSVNAALLHRAALKHPLSILKYAMTLDGKIATHTGHSAWVSSPQSRALVFDMRARSDAVVVGGNTVRRDNPRLTTRRDGGHMPARVVMSRTLDLPEDANVWDVSSAPTIVMTQRGARHSFQQYLKQRGVEVVEFDFLTPEHVAEYCFERGYLQVFWECGGTLAAPAISSGTIHRVMAFVAPKIIGGCRAPTPIGDLGFVEMTQAVNLVDTRWQQVGPDLLLTGYLPSSGGLAALEGMISSTSHPLLRHVSSSNAPPLPPSPPMPPPLWSRPSLASSTPKPLMFYKAWDEYGALSNFSAHTIMMPEPSCSDMSTGTEPGGVNSCIQESSSSGSSPMNSDSVAVSSGDRSRGISSSSLFSPPSSTSEMSATSSSSVEAQEGANNLNGWGTTGSGRVMDERQSVASVSGVGNVNGGNNMEMSGGAKLLNAAGIGGASNNGGASRNGVSRKWREWRSVEHYYQAQKFWIPGSSESMSIVEQIASAESPEEAARIGRRSAILHPHLVRPDWDAAKLDVMYSALSAKFRTHEGPRNMLLSTLRSGSGGKSRGGRLIQLAESSPHDFFWGIGVDGRGANHLGRLLMQLREELYLEAGGVSGQEEREREPVAR